MSTAAPWLAHYDEGVPATLAPYPDRTLVDYLADAARERPDAPALLFKGAAISFAHLERLSDACAAAFLSLGIRRGDRVVVRTREGEVMAKELKRRTAKTIELKSLNNAHPDRQLAVTDVLWIARIVWTSQ